MHFSRINRYTGRPLYSLFLFYKMSTWFLVVARVGQIDNIADSLYRNALCQFEEGSPNLPKGDWRDFYIAFYGDLLENGKAYILWGSARLPGNHETSAPMVCNLPIVLIVLLL
jgi:hypothetical protein